MLCYDTNNDVQNVPKRFKSAKKRFTMSVNGDKIQKYLESFQSDMSEGFQECDHDYSRNGTISCIKCGKITDV